MTFRVFKKWQKKLYKADNIAYVTLDRKYMNSGKFPHKNTKANVKYFKGYLKYM